MPTPARTNAFSAVDWLLLSGTALMWGASFLLIDFGLATLHPAAIAWLRLLFGVVALACIPAARAAVPRREWPWIALLGAVWMAVPFLLFPVAQQWIASSLAGMINAASPLFAVAVAAAWYRIAPGRWQLAGLATGFVGVIAIFLPTIEAARATALGAGMSLLAAILYGVAYNLAEPLQRRSGALPVVWRALLVALAMVTPFGLPGLAASSFTWQGVAAMAALGAFGTGLAFVAFTTLVGRVGAARASVTGYCIPVVAIVLGVAFRGESVGLLTLAGTLLVLIGAWLTSRRQG